MSQPFCAQEAFLPFVQSPTADDIGWPPSTTRDVDLVRDYPSPPSTHSHAKRSVPLPYELAPCASPWPPQHLYGGILDSPLVMQQAPLAALPISPPPTLPTTTHSLPEADADFSQDGIVDRHASGDAVAQDGSFGDFLPDTENEVAVTELAMKPQLLSPLSPEWPSHKIADTTYSHAPVSYPHMLPARQ